MKALCVLFIMLCFLTCSEAGRNQVESKTGDADRAAKNAEPEFKNLPVDASKYKSVTDAKDWQNPFLTIRSDGVGIRVRAISMNEERVIHVSDLEKTLKSLPLSAWPYGKVVAASEIGIRSGRSEENQLIERNRTEVERILSSLGVTVEWWPSN